MRSERERSDLSLNAIKSRLKALAAVEPPATLKDRLLAGIPRGAGAQGGPRGSRRSLGTVGWLSAAAAVAVGCALLWIGVISTRSGRPDVGSGSRSRPIYAADHNSLHPVDTNVCDNNSLH